MSHKLSLSDSAVPATPARQGVPCLGNGINSPSSQPTETDGRRQTPFSFKHNNTRPHSSLKATEHDANLGWTVLLHLPHSLDLAPSDCHLFRPMKDGLCGQQFPSNSAVIAAAKNLLVPIFTSVACRLWLIAGANA